MVYLRGSSKNYNLWERLGAAGWGFRDVVPYFHKLENFRIEEFQTSGKLQCLIFFLSLLSEAIIMLVPRILFFKNKWISLNRNDWHNYFNFKLLSGSIGLMSSVYTSSWTRMKYLRESIFYNFVSSLTSISFHKRPCNGQRRISDTPSTSRHLPESLSDPGAEVHWL